MIDTTKDFIDKINSMSDITAEQKIDIIKHRTSCEFDYLKTQEEEQTKRETIHDQEQTKRETIHDQERTKQFDATPAIITALIGLLSLFVVFNPDEKPQMKPENPMTKSESTNEDTSDSQTK